MGEEFYIRINTFMRSHDRMAAVLRRMDLTITVVVFASYPLFLIWAFSHRPEDLPKVVGVPLFGFLGVTAARVLIGKKRPYERYAIIPLIRKNTVGRSFPSRHAFSVFMIAETYLYATTDPFALPFYLLGLVLCACRVMLGVHYISDVSVGMVVALFCGVLYYIC